MPRKEAKQPSFEDLFNELELTIEKLEAGNLPLDESLALYEHGMELAKECSAQLDRAELRIQELAPDLIVQEEPGWYEAEDDADEEEDASA